MESFHRFPVRLPSGSVVYVNEARGAALDYVAHWYQTHLTSRTAQPILIPELLKYAEQVSKYLNVKSDRVIWIYRGPVFKQSGAIAPKQPKGKKMQLHDDEQVTYTLAGKDAKGFDVEGEQFSASSDNPNVAYVSQSGDSFTVVAGSPGSAVVTFSESGSGLSVTEAIDVVPGGVATISVTPGEVTKQGSAQSSAADSNADSGDVNGSGDQAPTP